MRLLSTALLLALASPVLAQKDSVIVGHQAQEPKSLIAAALREYLVPTLGYRYADPENWRKGVAPAAVRIAPVCYILGRMVLVQSALTDSISDTELFTAIGVMMAGVAWGVAGAVIETHRYNRRARPRSSLMLIPVRRRVAVVGRVQW